MSTTAIFLDIDGVLNQLQMGYYIDKRCVAELGRIVEKTNGEIVLTSSWRKGLSLLGKSSPQIEELKGYFDKYNIKIVGRTKDLGDRSKEIEEYISSKGIKNYLILDDDPILYDKVLDNTVFINCKTGLTSKDTKRILKLLK
jgi:phage FluMu protein gp41